MHAHTHTHTHTHTHFLSPLSIPPNFASGEILNNQKAMEYNTQTGNLTCAFNFMQLRRIKRNSDKKASEVSPMYPH